MTKKLSLEDQKLLKTDLGEYEKIAEQQLEAATEAYNFGADYAVEVAQNIEKKAQAKLNEVEMIKSASDKQIEMADGISSFMMEGFNDGLAKIAHELYGNEDVFFVRNSVPMLKTAGYDTSVVEKDLASLGLGAVIGVDSMSLLTKVAAEEEDEDEEEDESEKNASTQEEALAIRSYNHGVKLAGSFVSELLKVASESEKEEEEDEEEDEQEKKASAVDPATYKLADELSMFVERGFFDKLAALSQEVYGDSAAYTAELVKEAGKMDFVKNLGSKAKSHAGGAFSTVKETGKKGYSKAKDSIKKDYAGMTDKAKTKAQRAGSAGMLAAKTVLPAGVAVEGGRRMMSKEASKMKALKDLATKAKRSAKEGYTKTTQSAKSNLATAKGVPKFDSLGVSSKAPGMKERAVAGGKLLGAGAAVGGAAEMARRKMMSKEASKMQAIRDAAGRLKGSVAGSARNFRDGVKKDYSAAIGKPMTKVKGNIISTEKGNLKDRAMAAGRLGLKAGVPAGAVGGSLYAATKKKKED